MDHSDAIRLLEQLIRIPAPSGEEKARADLLEEFLRSRCSDIHRHGNNVWAVAPGFDSGRPTVMLEAHIDTVTPSDSWTRDPFTPVIEEGRLYGLGSNDTGASVVSMLAVFLNLKDTPQPYNLIWCASAEEERTGEGGVSSILDLLPPISLGIVGEPTGMDAAIAEKGLLVLDCTATGVAGHAARDNGENAIYKAMRDIAVLSSYSFDRVSDTLGKVRMSVTCIQAGRQHNIIPDRCTFTVDIRPNGCYTNSEILDTVRSLIQSEAVPRSMRRNSSSIPREHPAVRRAAELGRGLFGSPTLSDQAVMPFTTMKMGPGDSRRSHTADEYIRLDEISEAIEIFTKLLDRLDIAGV